MSNHPLILVIEDDQTVSGFMSAILSANDYKVLHAATGKEAILMTASYLPDIILLDLGLPDMDGINVLKTIRQWSKVPILVVSARGTEREKIEALDLGADDYITKPFGPGELLARIRTEIRHSQHAEDPALAEKMVTGNLEVNYAKRLVLLDGKEIHLTPIEYKILVVLAKHIGKVLTYDFIIREVWGAYGNDIWTLRVNISNIRKKIEDNSAEPRYIVTEMGVGYRMAES